MGGGFDLADASLQVFQSGPVDTQTWSVRVRNIGGQTRHLTVTALCIGNS